MKKLSIISLLLIIGFSGLGQSNTFNNNLTLPRLDTTFWSNDVSNIFTFRPNKTEECLTCFTSNEDSIINKTCFNSTSGHVKLDTVLEKITLSKLIGEWKLYEGGVFEISDSINNSSRSAHRNKIIHSYTDNETGKITFTENTLQIESMIKKKLKKKKRKYEIIDGKHLYFKKPLGQHGNSSSIGITKEGLLIMDNSNYVIIKKYGYYVVFKTIITRSIFQKLK
ncbi:MAG: hypothetical protein P8Q14_01470 [Vicingaceae bacterium]|nr:hypothetical protein [Vicingaceae bacterium]